MTYVVDILFVAIFLFILIKHARLGLACSVLSAGRFFISVIAALLLCYPIASLMYGLGVPEAFSGIIAFVAVFIAVMIISKLIIKMLSKIKIPIITKLDKFLGAILGAVLGIIWMSVLSTVLYTVIEAVATAYDGSEIMNIYEKSHIFKFAYDLEIFEFIRNFF